MQLLPCPDYEHYDKMVLILLKKVSYIFAGRGLCDTTKSSFNHYPGPGFAPGAFAYIEFLRYEPPDDILSRARVSGDYHL